MHVSKIITYGTAAILAAVLSGCSRSEQAETSDTRFRVTDTLLRTLLVDTVKSADGQSVLTLTGSIAPDETKLVKLYPMVSGVAQGVKVQTGDRVSKGEILANLRSAEIAGYTRDLVASQADMRSAKRVLESTQDLYKSGLASGKDLEQANADYQKAVAENGRAGSVLSINRTNSRGYEITSPLNGFVIEKNVTDDMQVRADNSQSLFTIADLSSVYVMVNMYESDIAGVKVGDPVTITTLAYPDKVFTGKIDRLIDMLDPDSKVMRARVKIENPGNLLTPGMFANIKVHAKSGANLPAISANAIVFDNDKNYVVIIDGPSKVHIQQVTIAKRVEDVAYISSGLKPGERVVASRQVYLFESLKD